MRQLALGLGLLVTTAAFAKPPTVTTAGTSLTIDHQQCLVKAAAAMAKIGFTDDLNTSGQSVYGNKGDYSATIRCFEDPDFAVFTVAGPNGSSEKTDAHNRALFDAFGG